MNVIGLTVVKVLGHSFCNLDATESGDTITGASGRLADVVFENGCLDGQPAHQNPESDRSEVDGDETICARKFEHVGYGRAVTGSSRFAARAQL